MIRGRKRISERDSTSRQAESDLSAVVSCQHRVIWTSGWSMSEQDTSNVSYLTDTITSRDIFLRYSLSLSLSLTTDRLDILLLLKLNYTAIDHCLSRSRVYISEEFRDLLNSISVQISTSRVISLLHLLILIRCFSNYFPQIRAINAWWCRRQHTLLKLH